MKNTLIFLLLAACVYMNFERDFSSNVYANRIANAYCEGKGYDQGFRDDEIVWCQKITIKQDSFEYSI